MVAGLIAYSTFGAVVCAEGMATLQLLLKSGSLSMHLAEAPASKAAN
jgi:hypothetical protein